MKRWINSLFACPASTAAPRTAAAPRLGVEQLDRRDLPSITLMTGGEIRIGCDGSSDTVTVRHDTGSQSHVFDDKIVVRREFGTKVEEESFTMYKLFSGQVVKSIHCDLQGGTNSFNNMTGLPSVVQGGSGRDDMYGGSERDVFYGNGGTDFLFGNNGRDRLYGGEGTDNLFGGEGLDGLAGGGGTDVLVGGGGSDRFLLTTSRDVVLDGQAVDAAVYFENTGAFQSPNSSTLYWGGDWTHAEVETVDNALAALHERTGNNTLLKTSDGDDLSFYRVGGWLTGDKVDGWNDNDGGIFLTQSAFMATPTMSNTTNLYQTVLHEVGHNWDDEWGYLNGFTALSVWIPTHLTSTDFTNVSKYGENWAYKSNSQFVSSYATAHPMEDFAESFAAYFLNEMDIAWGNPAPAKMTWMDDHFLDVFTIPVG